MPFDPKIIAAEDPPLTADGDIDLPADFVALGEQLRDDAVHLASRYPAGASNAADISAAQKWRFRRVFAVAGLVTSIVAASLIALSVFHFGGPASTPRASFDRAGLTTRSSFVSSIAPSETISLSELSQPELEAVLDLMEREPHTPVSVSF